MSKAKAFVNSPLGFRQKSLWGSNGNPTVLFITQRTPVQSLDAPGFVEALMGCYLYGPQGTKGPARDSIYHPYTVPDAMGVQSQFTSPVIVTIDPTGANPSLANYVKISIEGYSLIVISPGNFPDPETGDPGDIDYSALFSNAPFTNALRTWLINGGRLLLNGESNIYPPDSLSEYAPFTVNNISYADKIALNAWLGVLGSSMQLGSGSYVTYVTPQSYTPCPDELYPLCDAALPPIGSPNYCQANYPTLDTPDAGFFPGVGVNPNPSVPVSALGTLLQSSGLYGCGSANIYYGNGVQLYSSAYPAFTCSEYGDKPVDCTFDYNVNLGDRVNPNNTCVMAVERIGNGFLFLSGDASIYNYWSYYNYGGSPLPVLTNMDFFSNIFWLPQQTFFNYYAEG